MTPMDWLLIADWVVTILITLGLAVTPWRLTRRATAIDLSDSMIGRAVSPMHVFAIPAVALAAPLVAQWGGGRAHSGWAHPHALLPGAPIALVALVIAQLSLRAAILKAVAQRRAAQAQLQAVLASGRSRSARRPR